MDELKTKMVKVSSINHQILLNAQHRAEYRDDPCAEYCIGDGWVVVAEDVSKAMQDGATDIKVYEDLA